VATLTIRDLDDALKLKLRLRAAGKNRETVTCSSAQ